MSDTPSEDDISTLIREVGSQFQRSGTDLQALQKAVQDHGETEKVRNEMLQDTRSVLQDLSRTVQLTKAKGNRKNIDVESESHDNFMIKMDHKKFAVAQAIQDMDQSITSLEAEIHQLRMESLGLDSTRVIASGASARGKGAPQSGTDKDDDDGDDIIDDTAHAMAVLRLQLYRGLGIEMIENDLGVYSKARIRSHNKTDVHMVKFDGQLTPYFQTNLIWEFAS
ncbi:kinetochore-associated Ndc80 complex subunit spc24 [Podila epicladia]|nr:kinetochore-associated Ndc80 complex subunit spc24 [Podila epicladia]KAG0100278.1 kinetochore-associated Ndc80 complex subunit spc24 [Podila epicladia]